MTDERHTAAHRPPPRRTERIPGELLFEFVVGDVP
jgi:hypothetical protein